MGAVLETMPGLVLAAAMAITFFGGVVKGVVGFALPLVMISGLGALLPPEIALAALLLPAALTNMWQAFRQGLAAAALSLRGHWPFMAIGLAVMAVTAQFVLAVPQWAFFAIIGGPVVVYSALQLAGVPIRVPAHRRGVATVLFGGLAGILGGFSAVFGPPTVAYLISRDTQKAEQVRVQGMMYFLGNVLLFGAHLRSGVLNADTIPLSALMLLPAAAGMWLGFRLQDRMNRAQFLRATLVVLLLAGLNLVRRAIFV
ncbi:sulfite exporter TauE/SafE family protein [Rhodobacteraceae bacterium W635]|uniref:sulfite exporter TauE/SafE family protein n=1 Tax=Nioella halotolerans TaxID=2303578 RepID=UPI000E3D8D02|nr:sulfite exporter TauE/SafE family protein [Rhodobacteraceae bacterium W635]